MGCKEYTETLDLKLKRGEEGGGVCEDKMVMKYKQENFKNFELRVATGNSLLVFFSFSF